MAMLNINIQDLETLVTNLNAISTELDSQKAYLNNTNTLLGTALTGDYIAAFDEKFSGWLTSIANIIDYINYSSAALNTISQEVEAQVAALNSINH